MNFKVSYKVQNKMDAPELSGTMLDGEIGARFDRFAYERVSGGFAIKEILKEAEDCFRLQYDDEYTRGMWRNEFWGKLVLSAVRVCRMKKDGQLKADIRDTVYTMLSYQRADGYLSAYRDSENIFKTDAARSLIEVGWECDYNWNVWGQKYTLWALIESAMLLDDERVLGACVKMADHLVSQIKRLGVCVTDAGVMHGMAAGSIMKPMLLLYRLTGKADYLDLCLDIAKDWDREDGKMPNLIANALSGVPVSKWYSAESGWCAKAYEMMSCFDGIVELYRIVGDERHFNATTAYWELLNKYELNILGSVGYCERLADAKEYPDSATEVCDAIHWMRLSYELFILTGEAKYVEAFERTFLNAFLAGVFEDGRGGAFFVRSAGRHWSAEPQVEMRYQHCCVNNVPRGFANAAQIIMTKGKDGYYVNSYLHSVIEFGKTRFRISQGYVDNGSVAITVRGAEVGTKIHLRVPEWSDGVSLLVDCKRTEYNACGEYITITLDAADTYFFVEFKMKTELIDFGGEYRELPASDYHRQRWCDASGGLCGREQMVYREMSIIRRGPLLLARSKRVGCTEQEMFSGESVHGTGATATAKRIRHDHMLTACRVTIDVNGESRELVMCDYASAANRDLEDVRFFSVFV